MGELVGYCPMGCGQTLFVSGGGYVTCSYLHCPRRDAVADLLADKETEHVVVFDETGFTVKHPLRERLDDALLDCQLHVFCANLEGPPVEPGRYRTTQRADGGWHFLKMFGQPSTEDGDSHV